MSGEWGGRDYARSRQLRNLDGDLRRRDAEIAERDAEMAVLRTTVSDLESFTPEDVAYWFFRLMAVHRYKISLSTRLGTARSSPTPTW